MAKTAKLRRAAPRSGENEIRGQRGGAKSKEHLETATPKKKKYTLHGETAAPRSGENEIRGQRGGAKSKEHLETAAPKKKKYTLHGETGKYALITKSGRTILLPPVKSAYTISAWSKAFKK
jgi:hypothetical protein